MKTPNLLSYFGSGEWADVKKAVEKIYDGPDAVVSKTTRLGFTTSMTMIADERGDKLLHVKPTNKINETIKKAAPSMIAVYGHKHCQLLADQEDPLLLELPLSLPGVCPRGPGGCEEYPDCDMTRSWFETANVRTLSYQKLVAIIYGYNATDSEIAFLRGMLNDVKIILFDESHTISLENSPTADLNYTLLSIPQGFETLNQIYGWFGDLTREIQENGTIDRIKDSRDLLKSDAFLSIWQSNTHIVHANEQSYAFAELKALAKQRSRYNISEDAIKFLLNVISLMSCSDVTANLTITGTGDKWSIKGKPTYMSPTWKNAIKVFLQNICPRAKVFFVSGTQFEKYPGMFSEIANRRLEYICLPDVKQNNSKMIIIPDTWTYSSVADQKNGSQLKRILEGILDILADHPCDPIYVVCATIKLQQQITKKLTKYKLPKGFFIQDYYRSSNSMGVECEARIGIAIGIANTPTNTYDFATENVAESRALRLQDVHSATWQAWSRVKDPAGQIPSRLYCIGVKSDAVDAVIAQGSRRQVTYNSKGQNGRHIPPTITFSEELPRPVVTMVRKKAQCFEPQYMTTSNFLDGLVPVTDHPKFNCLKSVKIRENHLYNSIGEKHGKTRVLDSENEIEEVPIRSSFRLYNFNVGGDLGASETFLALRVLMVSRDDKCGLQSHYPNATGKFGYNTGNVKEPMDSLLLKHLDGFETVALPPFSPEDICYWAALDLDDHDGTNSQDSNILKITEFLESLNIPHFAERSGSYSGCHVIIPLFPGPTYTAYKFIRQLLHDVGLEGADIEHYPKQKSVKTVQRAKGYGNHLKLPTGYNWKAGRRAVLIDPHTLEPVPYVEITHVLRLREIPEPLLTRRKIKVVINATKLSKALAPNRDFRKAGFRKCLLDALQYELTGSDGNDMRVVIASEVAESGMDREEAITLFAGQSDFNYTTTASYIDYYINKKYHSWKCETIREKCSKFVDCSKCPYAPVKEDLTEIET